MQKGVQLLDKASQGQGVQIKLQVEMASRAAAWQLFFSHEIAHAPQRELSILVPEIPSSGTRIKQQDEG